MSKEQIAIRPINPDPHPNKPLGLGALLTIAIGNVFSASVYSLQAPASGLTGRSAWLAFAVAVVIGFLTVLPYLLLSGAIAFKGGDFTLVQLGLGKMASGLFVSSLSTASNKLSKDSIRNLSISFTSLF